MDGASLNLYGRGKQARQVAESSLGSFQVAQLHSLLIKLPLGNIVAQEF